MTQRLQNGALIPERPVFASQIRALGNSPHFGRHMDYGNRTQCRGRRCASLRCTASPIVRLRCVPRRLRLVGRTGWGRRGSKATATRWTSLRDWGCWPTQRDLVVSASEVTDISAMPLGDTCSTHHLHPMMVSRSSEERAGGLVPLKGNRGSTPRLFDYLEAKSPPPVQ